MWEWDFVRRGSHPPSLPNKRTVFRMGGWGGGGGGGGQAFGGEDFDASQEESRPLGFGAILQLETSCPCFSKFITHFILPEKPRHASHTLLQVNQLAKSCQRYY